MWPALGYIGRHRISGVNEYSMAQIKLGSQPVINLFNDYKIYRNKKIYRLSIFCSDKKF